MSAHKLRSPVGWPGKTANRKNVKNTPTDVIIMRRMLSANGYKVAEDGKFDGKLGTAIQQAQKRAGVKTLDGVVMPGDAVCKALTPRYLIVEKQAANVKMLSFRIGGRNHEMLPEHYKLAKDRLFKKVEGPTRNLITQVDHTMERYQFYLDVAMVKDGIAMALVQASIMTIGRVRFPDDKKMVKALDARNALQLSLRSRDLKLYCEAIRTAERDINLFVTEFQSFAQKMDSNGQAIQGKLKVVKTSAFASAEILAVPVIMTYTRLPPDKAYVASKTALAGVESLATDLGKHIAGQKVTVAGSLGRAGYESAKALVLGWAGGRIKFKGKLLTRTMKVLGPALNNAFPFIPKGMAANFAARYIQGFGEEAQKEILNALITAVELWVKKGVPPSKAEIDKMMDDVVMKAALGGLGKNLGKFNKAWAQRNASVLRGKMIPMALKKIDSNHVVNSEHREALIELTLKKVQATSMETAYKAVFAEATGHETAGALTKKAEDALKADRAVTSEIEAILRKEVKALEKAAP